MRNGFLGSLFVLLAGAGAALAQMPAYPYGAGAYPYSTPPYYAMYGNPWLLYGGGGAMPMWNGPPVGPYYGPPAPAYCMPVQPYCAPPPCAEQDCAPQRKRPKLLGWPPPCQVLPPSNPPPPQVLSAPDGEHAAAPAEETHPGTPLACEAAPCCPAEPSCPQPPAHPMPDLAPCGYRWYGSAEALYWWTRHPGSVPLVATGPVGTGAVLVDAQDLDDRQHWGGRFTGGAWLDCDHTCGIEGTYLFLAPHTPNTVLASPGTATLGVPFFNVAGTGAEALQAVSAPGTQSGAVAVQGENRLWAAEVNLRKELWRCCRGHGDLLIGGRVLELDEGLQMADSTMFLAGPAAGTSLTLQDSFGTHNWFYGGQVGGEVELNWWKLYVDVWGKVAIGNCHEVVNINGGAVQVAPTGAVTTAGGGLLAQPTNSGHFSHDAWAVLPEVGVNVGCQVTDWMRVYGGYSFLYLNRAVRPGDQIDRGVNPTQVLMAAGGVPALTGDPRPQFVLHQTEFWAQGVNVGVEIRY